MFSTRAERTNPLWQGAILLWLTGFSSVGQDASVPPPGESGKLSARSYVEEKPASDWGEDYQIKVVGDHPGARVMFTRYCEELRREFRALVFKIRSEDVRTRRITTEWPWRIPIRVELYGEPDTIFRGDYLRNGAFIRPDHRLQLRMQVRLHDRFQEEDFRLEFVKVLIKDQMLESYADRPGGVHGKRIEPPPWIVHGFDQLIDHRRGGSPSAFYEGFFHSGQVLSPDRIFHQTEPNKLDPLSYDIFRASAAAMVKTLLDLEPDGDASMRSLLYDLGAREDVAIESLLKQHFPAFREMGEGIEKWWALELASLGSQQRTEYLSPRETEEWLDRALAVSLVPEESGEKESAPEKRNILKRFSMKRTVTAEVPKEFNGRLEDYQTYLDMPGAEEELVRAFQRIQQLKLLGFPLYRPVLTRYERIVEKLGRRKLKDIDTELRETAELREQIGQTLRRAEDYQNHFEATRAPKRSRAFDGYMELRRKFDEDPGPARNDPFTRYIDAIEEEFR